MGLKAAAGINRYVGLLTFLPAEFDPVTDVEVRSHT